MACTSYCLNQYLWARTYRRQHWRVHNNNNNNSNTFTQQQPLLTPGRRVSQEGECTSSFFDCFSRSTYTFLLTYTIFERFLSKKKFFTLLQCWSILLWCLRLYTHQFATVTLSYAYSWSILGSCRLTVCHWQAVSNGWETSSTSLSRSSNK